jgi:hypothetical protein
VAVQDIVEDLADAGDGLLVAVSGREVPGAMRSKPAARQTLSCISTMNVLPVAS